MFLLVHFVLPFCSFHFIDGINLVESITESFNKHCTSCDHEVSLQISWMTLHCHHLWICFILFSHLFCCINFTLHRHHLNISILLLIYLFLLNGQVVMLLSCILAFFLNYSIFLNTTLNSALTQTICGNLKVCFTVFLAYYVHNAYKFDTSLSKYV